MTSELLWALSRASGLVLLPLFTLVVVLGVLTHGGRRLGGRSPRWVTPLVHRSLALAALGFLVVHVGSVVADGYVDVSLLDVVVPFASGYRPVLDRPGHRRGAAPRRGRRPQPRPRPARPAVWRAVHALAWPFLAVSLAHALGVGSDTRTPGGWPWPPPASSPSSRRSPSAAAGTAGVPPTRPSSVRPAGEPR